MLVMSAALLHLNTTFFTVVWILIYKWCDEVLGTGTWGVILYSNCRYLYVPTYLVRGFWTSYYILLHIHTSHDYWCEYKYVVYLVWIGNFWIKHRMKKWSIILFILNSASLQVIFELERNTRQWKADHTIFKLHFSPFDLFFIDIIFSLLF